MNINDQVSLKLSVKPKKYMNETFIEETQQLQYTDIEAVIELVHDMWIKMMI